MPTHSRIDRWYGYVDVLVTLVDGSPAIPGSVSTALVPPGGTVTATTEWIAQTLRGGQLQILFAGPDADPAGAVVVPSGGADLFARVADDPEATAVRVTSFAIA